LTLLVIRLLGEVMILPVTIIGLLAYKLAYVFDCLVFLSVSNKQYTNSIRDLIVIAVFFSYSVLI